MVVTRCTACGAHAGEFQGIAATGRKVRVMGIDLDRIIDGNTVDCWVNMDQSG